MQGAVDGTSYELGRPTVPVENEHGHTIVELRRLDPAAVPSDESSVIGHLSVADQPKPSSAEAIARFRRLGLSPVLLTGDNAATAQSVAEQVGIDQVRAEVMPADKVDVVRELQEQGRTVAMVGDGINDSPVLAGANVSIAMGSGTSLAQHSADCVLMHDNLHGLTQAFATARRTMQIVRQNLWWAIGYNVIALPLAASGVLAPWMAALGMSASSLLVTGNALRLSRVRKRSSSMKDVATPSLTPVTAEKTA